MSLFFLFFIASSRIKIKGSWYENIFLKKLLNANKLRITRDNKKECISNRNKILNNWIVGFLVKSKYLRGHRLHNYQNPKTVSKQETNKYSHENAPDTKTAKAAFFSPRYLRLENIRENFELYPISK